MKTNPNESIIPRHLNSKDGYSFGLTKREFFACKAEIPWNVVYEGLAIKGITHPTIKQLLEYRSAVKVVEADALIEALNKESNGKS